MKKLIILFLLFVSSFYVLGASELTPKEKTYWKFLRSKLFNGNSNVYRYNDDIRLQLYRNSGEADSLYMVQLVKELNGLMESCQIEMVKDSGNFVLNIDNPARKGRKNFDNLKALPSGIIIKRNLGFNLKKDLSQQERNRFIAYYIVRGLTQINQSQKTRTGIEGAIFEEQQPENSTFHDADKFIINKIYSSDFYSQLKKGYPGSYIEYVAVMFPDLIPVLGYLIVILFVSLMLFVYIKRGVFEQESFLLKIYFKQGLYLLLIYFIIQIVPALFKVLRLLLLNNSVPFLNFSFFVRMFIYGPIVFFINGCIVIGLMYFIENKVFKSASENIKLLVILITSFIIPWFFYSGVLLLKHAYLRGDITNVVKFLIIIILFAILRTGYRFLNYKTRQTIRQKDIELANLEKLKQQAELQALHSRINPHFLYNSLNSIAGLAHADADRTEQMALSLSDFCRSAINKQNKDTATVKEEVEMVSNYLEIEKVRLGARLNYEIKVDENVQDVEVPRFLLQPLVENAIKHGVAKMTGIGQVCIIAELKDDKLHLRVFDNGPAFPDELISGYGLQSLFDKLEILYSGKARIVWENQPEKYICVVLPVKTQLSV